MESVDYYDKYLDPPEYSSRFTCEECGGDFSDDYLNRVGGCQRSICDGCLDKLIQEYEG